MFPNPVLDAELAACLAAPRTAAAPRTTRTELADLKDQSDVFGLYVATVRRAMLVAENPTPALVERAMAALDTCEEVLEVSPTTNDARRAAALSTLEVLRHQVTDAMTARPSH